MSNLICLKHSKEMVIAECSECLKEIEELLRAKFSECERERDEWMAKANHQAKTAGEQCGVLRARVQELETIASRNLERAHDLQIELKQLYARYQERGIEVLTKAIDGLERNGLYAEEDAVIIWLEAEVARLRAEKARSER